MFKCGFCQQFSQPGDPQRRIIVETRKKVYTNGPEEEPITSIGSEIVSEVAACPACAKIREAQIIYKNDSHLALEIDLPISEALELAIR